MKRFRSWLLILGMVLVVIGSAVLPPWLSQARDREFFNHVNAEETADTLFSPVEDLTKRVELLARWYSGGDVDVDAGIVDFTSEVLPMDMDKELDRGSSLVAHSSNLEQRALEALRTLAKSVPQIEARLPESVPDIRGERRFLYDSDQSGMIASYVNLSSFEEVWMLDLILDETTEKVLSLMLSGTTLGESSDEERETIARAFLQYLGVTGEESDTVLEDKASYVRLTGTDFYYYVYLTPTLLSIQPLTILPEEDGKQEEYDVVGTYGKPVTKVVEKK